MHVLTEKHSLNDVKTVFRYVLDPVGPWIRPHLAMYSPLGGHVLDTRWAWTRLGMALSESGLSVAGKEIVAPLISLVL